MVAICKEEYQTCLFSRLQGEIHAHPYKLTGAYGRFVDESKLDYVYMALTVEGNFQYEFNNLLFIRFLMWAELES